MDDLVALDLTMLAKELFPGKDYQLEQFIIVYCGQNGSLEQHYLSQL
ncbi:unnamed protein product, partial [Rotaria sordida]